MLQELGGTWTSADPTGSDAQLAWQHFPPCYAELMWQLYAGSLARYNVTSYSAAAVRMTS